MTGTHTELLNRILRTLPRREYDRLKADLSRVRLEVGDVLHRPDEETPFAYFPERGVLSLLTILENGSTVELATAGNEGMVDISLALGVEDSNSLVRVQLPGEAWRIPAGAFREHLGRMPVLQRQLGAYILALFTMTAQRNACSRSHLLPQRLSCWLLTTHDRVIGDEFPLTHDALADMLGTTRPGISTEMGRIEDAGAVVARRGRVKITDRDTLEAMTCECYFLVRERFDRLVGSRPRPNPQQLVPSP